jgi:hypothetical protein
MVLLVWLAVCALVALATRVGRRRHWVERLGDRIEAARSGPPAPSGRPIEAIARDAQRLGLAFRYAPPTLSFARFEGMRRAYDSVLAEACRALDVAHLLEVLPPGPELDRERQRVESLLDWAGLRLDDAA